MLNYYLLKTQTALLMKTHLKINVDPCGAFCRGAERDHHLSLILRAIRDWCWVWSQDTPDWRRPPVRGAVPPTEPPFCTHPRHGPNICLYRVSTNFSHWNFSSVGRPPFLRQLTCGWIRSGKMLGARADMLAKNKCVVNGKWFSRILAIIWANVILSRTFC